MINEYKYLQVHTPWGKCLKDDYSLQHLALPTPGSRLNAMYVLGGCPYCNYHLSSQTKPWNVTPWKFYANCFFPNLRYIELWFTAWGGADPLVMYASRKHGSAASWHLECFMNSVWCGVSVGSLVHSLYCLSDVCQSWGFIQFSHLPYEGKACIWSQRILISFLLLYPFLV